MATQVVTRAGEQQPVVSGYEKPMKHARVTVDQTAGGKDLATLLAAALPTLKGGQFPTAVYMLAEDFDFRFSDTGDTLDATHGYLVYAKSEYRYVGDIDTVKLFSTNAAGSVVNLYFVYA